MNRRKFFNMLGSAVIGTVIALKIPETIAPIKINNIGYLGIDALFKMIDDDLQAAINTMTANILKFGRPLTADEILEEYSRS